MRDLNHNFKRLWQGNRDGAFATQHDRELMLSLVADQLHEGGFQHLRAQGQRSKHIEHLVQRWFADGISPCTFKNRMGALRWLAEKIDKQNIVARDNAAYGIAERRHVNNESKAKRLNGDKLSRVQGLRHGYAQARYREMTGWKAPAAGGPSSKGLSPEQERVDREARLAISRELDHEREQITAVYLGR